MTNKSNPTAQTDIDRVSAAIAATPPDKQALLRLLAEAAMLGAQIAEQCRDNLSQQKDAS